MNQEPTKLFNRNYFLLFQGQLVSRLGSQVYAIAMVLWIKDATGSATLMGLLMMVSAIPGVLLSPMGGAIADRFSRRMILVISDLTRGLAMLVVAALIYTMADSVNLLLGTLFVVAILTGTVTAFFRPAIAAAIPDLVPKDRVVTANSLGQLSLQLSVFFGQGLGGTLFRLLGAPFLFLINGISFLYASFSESLIKMPEVTPKEELSVKEHWQAFVVDLKEGFRYAWNRPGLRELVFISAVINFFTIPAIVLLPFFVEDTLGVRVDWYGFILVSFGLGGLLGYLFAGIVRLPGRSRMYLMLTFMIGQSVLYGVLGFMPRPIFVVILAIVAGFMGGYITVNITTVLQLSTPSEIRGRVFGLLGMVAGGLTPIAMGLSGIIADALDQNIPLIYAVSGGIMVLLSILVALLPQTRDLLAFEVKPGDRKGPPSGGATPQQAPAPPTTLPF
jgi:MFS family permease